MGELKKWRDQKWVRIGTDGKQAGSCSNGKKEKSFRGQETIYQKYFNCKKRIMAKKFKIHKMYSKTGIVKTAKTMADHNRLKKQGYTHNKK